MNQKLVTRADFARLTGKSRPGVGKLCKGKLAPAMVGDLLDLNHTAAAEYLEAHRVDPATKPDRAPTKTRKKAKSKPLAKTKVKKQESEDGDDPTPSGAFPRPDENGFVAAFSDLTHKQIVDRYGTITLYTKILESHVKAENARKNWLDNEETEGKLIGRNFVWTHVFGYIDAAQKRILGDAPKTIAKRAMAMAKSDATLEEIERFVRDTLTAILRPARDNALRKLRPKKLKGRSG
jgi:hypothetical protein